MRNGKSYIKVSFDDKFKSIHSLSRDATLYLSIPYETGLTVLTQTLETRATQKISTNDIVTMAGFTLKNCFNKIRQQVLCIFKNDFGNKFLYTCNNNSLL